MCERERERERERVPTSSEIKLLFRVVCRKPHMWQSRVEIEDYSAAVKFEFLMPNVTLQYPLIDDRLRDQLDHYTLSYTQVNNTRCHALKQ